MAVIGIGLGLCDAVAGPGRAERVEPRDLGAGTSTATFFRSLGGSFGVAILGTILNNNLATKLADAMPAALRQLPADVAARFQDQVITIASPAQIKLLPAPLRTAVETSLTGALHPVFLISAIVAGVGVLLSLGIPDLKLRSGPPVTGITEQDDDAEAAAHTQTLL